MSGSAADGVVAKRRRARSFVRVVVALAGVGAALGLSAAAGDGPPHVPVPAPTVALIEDATTTTAAVTVDDATTSTSAAAPVDDATTPTSAAAPTEPEARRALTVDGNQLIGPDGSPMRLLGVNRSGAEYACVQGLGIWDGAADATVVDAMASWGINSVRVPLNEHCWLGINEAPDAFSGPTYRDAIVAFVDLLNERGLIAVLDLHWSGPGDRLAQENMPMPNADHSADFWRSVAESFIDHPFVLFDAFNEPHDIDWACWRDGCTMPEGYEAMGMQGLVDAIRSVGAEQPIVLSGLRFGNDLSEWIEMAPADPAGALVAGFHVYDFNQCVTPGCWSDTVAPVSKEVPVVTTELGEATCSSSFIEGYMDWADDMDVSYMGWTFNDWDCAQGPALILDESGTPTAFGLGFRDHLLELRRRESAAEPGS